MSTRQQPRVTLAPLSEDDRDQFVHDNQEAFNCGALEEFIGSDSQELFACFQAL